MLESLELQVFPSCHNCLSWSEDGEIAVATGENVQILTPKASAERGETSTLAQGSNNNWHTTRFRTNVFTSKEWPIIFPQPRHQFALGAEQSASHVVGLAWSPPGIGKYRRCILAVLTSNLVLSLYESIGTQSKWTRIGIVNKALESHFDAAPQGSRLPKVRKTNIQSFTWGPALRVPTTEQPTVANCIPRPESRWGFNLLTVANDDNDLIVLQVKIPSGGRTTPESVHFEVLSVTSISDRDGSFQNVQPNSIFASSLQSQSRILSVASGPWLYQEGSEDEELSATANVAAIYGTRLKLVKINISVRLQDQRFDRGSRYHLLANAEESPLVHNENLTGYHFTGPLHWVPEIKGSKLYLAIGAQAGVVLVSLSTDTYTGKQFGTGHSSVHYYPLTEDPLDDRNSGILHYERISAMAVTLNEGSGSPVLHIGTVGGYGSTMSISDSGDMTSSSFSPWKGQLDDTRERFDIDRDLGGLAVSRVWGLTSAHGLVAGAVTMHPGDMVEYRTSAEERTTIIISPASEKTPESAVFPIHKTIVDLSMDLIQEKRDAVLQYILQTIDEINDSTALSPKVIYAAACCAIVGSQSSELLFQARKALEKLAKTTGTKLTDEIIRCSAPGNSISPKSTEELNGSGKDIFEMCAVCDAGLAWYSTQEAQCANGHLFVRCNLTSLAIQEPGTSKFCSNCKAEYLDEDLIDLSTGSDLQNSCGILSEVFDTCIYCNGKFRS